MKKFTLKSTATRQCSTSKTVSSNSYLISLSIHNYITSDQFINTTYESYVPPIDNEWGGYEIKDGEEYLNSQQHMSTKQTLKLHVQKSNEMFFRKKSLEQQCVPLNTLLIQGESYTQYFFTGLDYADLNSQCLSNEKHLFSETLSPKITVM